MSIKCNKKSSPSQKIPFNYRFSMHSLQGKYMEIKELPKRFNIH